MDRETHKKILDEILKNLTNQAEVSNLLLELTNENEKDEIYKEELTKNVGSLTDYNKELLKANNTLFRKISSNEMLDNGEENNVVEGNTAEENEEEYKLENLFKEGELI